MRHLLIGVCRRWGASGQQERAAAWPLYGRGNCHATGGPCASTRQPRAPGV